MTSYVFFSLSFTICFIKRLVGVVHHRVEHSYQNLCDVMVAAEKKEKEEIERLLVAHKSIVISSRDRIVELERTGIM